jgi:hypothetical protein
MGGSSSSSSAATTQTDNRRVIGQNGISAENSNVTVNNTTLDAEVANHALDTVSGVVGAASGIANTAISASTQDLSLSLNFATTANAKALDSLNTTSNLVKDAYADAKGRGALTDKILIGAIVMAGVIALAAVRK